MPKHDKHDNFLAEAVKAKPKHMGYMDGFRFGLGFFLAGLLMTVILGGLTWGMVVALRLQ